jgi:hypothetical protein
MFQDENKYVVISQENPDEKLISKLLFFTPKKEGEEVAFFMERKTLVREIPSISGIKKICVYPQVPNAGQILFFLQEKQGINFVILRKGSVSCTLFAYDHKIECHVEYDEFHDTLYTGLLSEKAVDLFGHSKKWCSSKCQGECRKSSTCVCQ